MKRSLVRIGRISILTAVIIVAIAALRGSGLAAVLSGWCLFLALGYLAARRGTLDYRQGRCELPLWLFPAVLVSAASFVPAMPAGTEVTVLVTRALVYGSIAALFTAAIYYYTALQDAVPWGHRMRTDHGSGMNRMLFFLAVLHSLLGMWNPSLVLFTAPDTYPPAAWTRLYAVDVFGLLLLKDAVLASSRLLPGQSHRERMSIMREPCLELLFWLAVLWLICKRLCGYSEPETWAFVFCAALLYLSVFAVVGTAACFLVKGAPESEAAQEVTS